MIKFAVCALITNREGKILAVSRKHDRTIFGLPGGKVEEGETLIQALSREVKEETGLDVLMPKLIFGNLSASKGYYILTYRCLVAGQLLTPEEVADLGEGDIKWADWEDIESGHEGSYNRHLHYVFNKMSSDNELMIKRDLDEYRKSSTDTSS